MRTHLIRRNLIYVFYMRAKAFLAARKYGYPTREIDIITVTGTDGKSTTSAITYQILKSQGLQVGILSTVYLDTGAGLEDNTTKLTSISHGDFQRLVRQAVDNGYTHLVVEASSHALYQSRIRPTKAVAAGFTNLSREHLDFHWTMEHYAKTKGKVFGEYLADDGVCVLPQQFAYDDQVVPAQRKGTHQKKHIQRFGYTESATIRATEISSDPFVKATLHTEGVVLPVQTMMVGAFNVENMMIAVLLARAVGCNRDAIKDGLESFGGLPGRQQLVRRANANANANVNGSTEQEGAPTVMIDFALTPDALQTLYIAADSLGFDKIIAVFGATGERDQGKRPLMGQVAITHCDHVVLTDDEPYSEDGMSIIEQIENGIIALSKNDHRGSYQIVQDREEAIHTAISNAQPNDLVIVTGMANFQTRGMKHGNIDRDEEAVVRSGLQKY